MLPVLEIEDRLIETLRREGCAVLTAPTGSGKTTQVPQMVHRARLTDGRIVVLQPRRLATRMVAHRVAREMNCPIGTEVGYQTRHESAVSRETRVRFMTEGLLLRLLQADPRLSSVGVVMLDEFHERNVAADIALAMLKSLRQTHRPDLKIVVMSATLDADSVARYLACPSLHAEGRTYPIEVSYAARRSSDPPWESAAQSVGRMLSDHEGDVLVFMPGAYEIGRTLEACKRLPDTSGVRFFPLHGALSAAQQDAAVAPCSQRKVIVSTNVAETSITIEGVRCVVDSGLARVHRYDAERGVNVLRVEPISRASADQRAGRAGRTAPGVCARLWTRGDHQQVHPERDVPEIQRIELAEPLLQLRAMGVADPSHFPWLDPPPEKAAERGEAVLRSLHAVDPQGRLTPTGSRMAEFPAHPRISRMLLEAARLGCLARCVRWAAIIGDRDILTSQATRATLQHWMEPGEPGSDLAVRDRAMAEARSLQFDPRRCGEIGLHANTCRQVARAAEQLADVCRRLQMPLNEGTVGDAIRSLLAGYGDHLAIKHDDHRPHCDMPGRKKVVLDKNSAVTRSGLLVAVELHEIGRGNDTQTSLALACEVDAAWLASDEIRVQTTSRWNEQLHAVEQVEERCLGELVLDRKARPEVDTSLAEQMIVEKIMAGELKLTGWDESVEQWIARVRCVSRWFVEKKLIGYEADDVRVVLHELVGGATRFSALRDKPCLEAVRNALNWEEQRFVEQMAPAELKLPNGWRMKLEYEPGQPPRGRAKIQDLYGLDETPRVAGGRQAVLLEILGPNRRPLQVTGDLANFWKTLYPQLRNELKRRYPRHEWR